MYSDYLLPSVCLRLRLDGIYSMALQKIGEKYCLVSKVTKDLNFNIFLRVYRISRLEKLFLAYKIATNLTTVFCQLPIIPLGCCRVEPTVLFFSVCLLRNCVKRTEGIGMKNRGRLWSKVTYRQIFTQQKREQIRGQKLVGK